MVRSVNQIRPKGDPSAMPYSPQRDLANIYTPMLREVFKGLDETSWTPYQREWFAKEGITEEHLSQAVSVFVEAHQLFIRDREVDSPADAFEKAGIAGIPEPVRHALFSQIGQTIMGGFFVALRDVTMQGVLSPVHSDMVEMIAAGWQLAERLSNRPRASYELSNYKVMKANSEETGRALSQAHAVINSLNQSGVAQQKRISDLDSKIGKMTPFFNMIEESKRLGWFSRLRYVSWMAWKIYRKQL